MTSNQKSHSVNPYAYLVKGQPNFILIRFETTDLDFIEEVVPTRTRPTGTE